MITLKSRCLNVPVMKSFRNTCIIWSLKDKIGSYLVDTRTSMMPYITNDLCRVEGHSAWVIPQGCVNLALMGQLLIDDVVFVLKLRFITAMMAVYGLLDLKKPGNSDCPPQRSMISRVIASMIRMTTGNGEMIERRLHTGDV